MKDKVVKYPLGLFIFISFAFSDETDSLKTVAGYSCSACHIESGWTPISPSDFSHNFTPFPLTGFHRYTDCVTCHTGNTLEERHTFNTLSQNCYECHLDIHNSQMGNFCQDCHITRSWDVTSQQFRHETTAFPLLGAHRFVDCQSCHESANLGDYFGESTDCESCHLEDYQATFEPPHEEQIFLAEDCVSCHDATIWENTNFEHDLNSNNCNECHLANYNDALVIAPDHESFPQECETCHITTSWQESIFDHNLTDFPLEFSHELTDCSLCHIDSYQNTDTNCQSCHQDDYVATENPVHSDQVYLEDECATCHSAVGWDDILFDHVFTSENCNSCHNANYEIANINVEGHEEFLEDCTTCHTTQNWQENIFDHNDTSFRLEYSHLQVDCIDCHAEEYITTDTRCESCHLESFNMTNSPSHIDELFVASECANCHNADKWNVSIFNHNLSEFKLEGKHIDADCSSCHTHGYNETTHECSICHLEEYSTTTDPTHSDMIYLPNDCANCHTPENWNNSYSHDLSIINCSTCHKLELFNANINVEGHSELFSNCTECHNANDWNEINFSHDLFNISKGEHNKWDSCNDCHIYNSYFTFSCDGNCHSHNQPTMYEKHCNNDNAQCISCPELGLDYQNLNWEDDGSFFLQCLMCHPNGKEDGHCEEKDRFKSSRLIKFQKNGRREVK